MPIYIDPDETVRFRLHPTEDGDEPRGPVFLLRPLRAREEHAVLDLTQTWERFGYVLERALIGWEDAEQLPEFEAGSKGGASERAIRAMPTPWRAAVANRVLELVRLSEDDLGK